MVQYNTGREKKISHILSIAEDSGSQTFSPGTRFGTNENLFWTYKSKLCVIASQKLVHLVSK